MAVLKLTKRVRYEPHILPICLPGIEGPIEEGMVAMVAGKFSSTENNVNYQSKNIAAVIGLSVSCFSRNSFTQHGECGACLTLVCVWGGGGLVC